MNDNSRYWYSHLAVFLLLAVLIAAGGFLFFSRSKWSTEEIRVSGEIDSVHESVAEKQESVEEIKILFLGDIMFDRYIRQVAKRKGYDFVFQDVDNLLKEKDLVVANLEGPLTDNKSVSATSEFGERNNYIFTFDPQVAPILKNHNINLINLGNNHILNFRQNGLEQTKKYLSDAGVKYFCDKDIRYTLYKIPASPAGGHNTTLSFVCYNQFESDAVEKALADIGEVKKSADVVILYAHWGKEYETKADAKQKELAHKFIDAEADLIIGSHSHVVQEKEIYQGKTIYYSLGNFIFDQYFNSETMKGLAVETIINPVTKDIKFKEHQLQMKNNGQTEWKK
ncbi:MAG: CapA family protein [Candidatus Moranbacteria bacterium]|nr:CapA family protein [Candidatus Moranbacteria bacterium]